MHGTITNKNYHCGQVIGSKADILEDIGDNENNTRLSVEILLQKAISIRQNTYLESLAYLGENHPSFRFIKEVLDDFDKSFSLLDILKWFSDLKLILQNALDYELDRWEKELKRKLRG